VLPTSVDGVGSLVSLIEDVRGTKEERDIEEDGEIVV